MHADERLRRHGCAHGQTWRGLISRGSYCGGFAVAKQKRAGAQSWERAVYVVQGHVVGVSTTSRTVRGERAEASAARSRTELEALGCGIVGLVAHAPAMYHCCCCWSAAPLLCLVPWTSRAPSASSVSDRRAVCSHSCHCHYQAVCPNKAELQNFRDRDFGGTARCSGC
jgi:hypothetical protein